MRQQRLLVVARAVERGAVFGAVKTVLDRFDPGRAERKGRAADDHADQDARHEAQTTMIDDDGDQRRYSSFESRLRDLMIHLWSWSAPR